MAHIAPLLWHSESTEAVLARFGSSRDAGLSEEEASRRLTEYGKNEIVRNVRWRFLKLIRDQFTSPLVFILVAALLVTFFILKDYAESLIIAIALLVNAAVGIIQEGRASQAFEALQKTVSKTARVVRAGKLREVDSRDLVPGDIVELEAGMSIEADARLISLERFATNEAALTGEWIEQLKTAGAMPPETPLADRENMVWAGTLAEAGSARAIVVDTGMSTERGKIAGELGRELKTLTPFQRHLTSLSHGIGIIVLIIAVVYFAVGMVRGVPFETMFLTAVALAVSAVPEGLPIAVGVILALGVEHILKKGGLLKRLKSAETLGSTTVILTDKTGTLTTGEMEVSHVTPAGDSEKSRFDLLRCGLLTSAAFIENPEEDLSAWRIRGESTDRALLKAALASGISRADFEREHTLIRMLPFDTELRFAAAIYQKKDGGEYSIFISGAPEVILQRSVVSAEERAKLQSHFEDLTKNGARIIAGAIRHIKHLPDSEDDYFKHLTPLGFMGFHDPLRPDAKDAFRRAQEAGIRPVIVTGDHRLTAATLAHELEFDGMPSHIMEGSEFEKKEVDVAGIDIFARVLPHQKSLIVEAWQKKGEVVAMTGDGINDAPALKRADIGIALGSGTEVAKEAADLVLLNDSFSTILAAVEEGRTIIDNIRKALTFLLATAFTELILIGGALAAGFPLPILPAQILWMNMVGEGFFNFAFAFEKKEQDVLKQKPTKQFFTTEMKALIFIGGLVNDVLLLGIFFWLQGKGVELELIRSIVFLGLAINSFFFVFALRSLRRPLWRINFFSNPYLLFAFGASALLLLPVFLFEPLLNLLHLVPVPIEYVGIVIALGVVDLFCIELIKYVFIVRQRAMEPKESYTSQYGNNSRTWSF